ncbi:hypothetical protein [uncultured Microbacterium sp.]|uniref:hypothetical protein n=1 Tax=uncultured Microbacterium sp. TaxID=191216 RepID=UPI0028DC85AF|nr:hypothetical protein [uncultured Microbacterium sp.]
MNDGLFDFGDSAAPAEARPALMTPRQRQTIRELFAKLGIASARDQFDIVAEVTGVRITSVAELELGAANVLIRQLESRAAAAGRVSTGNSWADRDEDTWIDRL